MAEVYWTEKVEFPWNELNPHKQTCTESKSILVSDKAVTMAFSVQFTGINPHSHRRYFRWESSRRYGVRKNSNGLLVPFYISDRRFTSPFIALQFGWRNYKQEYRDVYHQALYVKFGITGPEDVYPGMKFFHLTELANMPSHFLPALRQDNFGDLIRVAFGKSRYRKDLVKICAHRSPDKIAYTMLFKDLVPIDWIIEYLRNNLRAQECLVRNDSGRKVLKNLNQRTLKNLLRDLRTPEYIITDTLAFPYDMPELQQERFRNWQELHDHLFVDQNDYYYHRTIPRRDVPLDKFSNTLHNRVFDQYRIVMATNTEEIVTWGKKQRHCIGTYAERAANKNTYIGGVYEGDEIVINFQIGKTKTGYRLYQAFAKCNATMDFDFAKKFEQAIPEVDTEQYWGKPQQKYELPTLDNDNLHML